MGPAGIGWAGTPGISPACAGLAASPGSGLSWARQTDGQTDRQRQPVSAGRAPRSGRGCHRVADPCRSLLACFPDVCTESFLPLFQHQLSLTAPESFAWVNPGHPSRYLFLWMTNNRKNHHAAPRRGSYPKGTKHRTWAPRGRYSDSQPVANLTSLIHSRPILHNAGR